MKSRIVLLTLCLTLLLSGLAFAAPVTDIVQAPTGYFVPDDSLKYDYTYWRGYYQDWEWTHGAIGGSFTTATLNISAFDVDNYSADSSAEHDLIYAYDSGAWILLGELAGASDIWSYTEFDLPTSLFDDIATGLQIKVDIDTTTNGYWLLTLAKSVLTTDNGFIPDPEPNPTPEPSTLALAALGLAGAFCLRRKFKN